MGTGFKNILSWYIIFFVLHSCLSKKTKYGKGVVRPYVLMPRATSRPFVTQEPLVFEGLNYDELPDKNAIYDDCFHVYLRCIRNLTYINIICATRNKVIDNLDNLCEMERENCFIFKTSKEKRTGDEVSGQYHYQGDGPNCVESHAKHIRPS